MKRRARRPVRLALLRKSRRMQRWLMCNPWTRPMLVFAFAALRIQQVARGYIVRKHGSLRGVVEYRRQRQQQVAAARKHLASSQRQLDKYLAYLDRANARVRQQSQAAAANGGGGKVYMKPAWLDGGYSAWCAVRIQAMWRRSKPRRRFMYKKRFVLQIACLIVQTAYRNRIEWKRQVLRSREFSFMANAASPRRKEEMQSFAVRRIQQSWRAFCNRKVYKYYRDLVCFKLQGAPADLLKTIIPQETGLFDKASGVHVRFRLGGSSFPPKVYFKVFTHRPLCDVNAFAPRDYTKESKPDAFHNNNYERTYPKYGKFQRSIRVGAKYFGAVVKTASADTTSWYRREENNPWRPIASQLVEEVCTPPWQQRDVPVEKKPAAFHFSTYKRREEILRQKKRRKREWMLKAYLLASGKTLGAELQEADLARGAGANADADLEGNYFQSSDADWADSRDERRDEMAAQSKESKELELMWMEKAVLSHSEEQAGERIEDDLADLSLGEAESKSTKGAVDRLTFGKLRTEDKQQQQHRNIATMVEVVLPAGGSKGIAAALRSHRPKVDDEDDDDLINWTAALDFDDYTRNWAQCGTSRPS